MADAVFSSLVTEIKAYSGKDPLLPWLRAIKRMRGLPPEIIKEKLPRLLKRCARSFESDRRYKDDPRYLSVWMQLLDFVDDPKALRKAMETKQIGTKWALFYQEYALQYEKLENFEEAEKMYLLGMQNLAHPVGELQRSYDQFLRRMDRFKRRKERTRLQLQSGLGDCSISKAKEVISQLGGCENKSQGVHKGSTNSEKQQSIENKLDEHTPFSNDETVVRFVGSASVGKSQEAVDAYHHGVVEPTINMEAMNATTEMFEELLQMNQKDRRSRRGLPEAKQTVSDSFKMFLDESLDTGAGKFNKQNQSESVFEFRPYDHHPAKAKTQKTVLDPFEMFVEGEDNEGDDMSSDTQKVENPSDVKYLKDDAITCEFLGSDFLGEAKMENACHHGLLDHSI